MDIITLTILTFVFAIVLVVIIAVVYFSVQASPTIVYPLIKDGDVYKIGDYRYDGKLGNMFHFTAIYLIFIPLYFAIYGCFVEYRTFVPCDITADLCNEIGFGSKAYKVVDCATRNDTSEEKFSCYRFLTPSGENVFNAIGISFGVFEAECFALALLFKILLRPKFMNHKLLVTNCLNLTGLVILLGSLGIAYAFRILNTFVSFMLIMTVAYLFMAAASLFPSLERVEDEEMR